MDYISTRDRAKTPHSFSSIMMAALAPDGGLYVPASFPALDVESLKGKSYQDIAFAVIRPFVDLTDDELKTLIQKSYNSDVFRDEAVTPLVPLTDNLSILELFHGPTLAFKDVALQFLGHLFDLILEKQNKTITIIGATSGDTGSAALEAFRAKERVKIIILHPHERTSDIQRRQMTTIKDRNVFNIALRGNFDDAQSIVKRALNDCDVQSYQTTTAVNSINWARIVAQIVYYVVAVVRLLERGISYPSFAVPTGNFGNIYAGYVAKRMGVPIGRLIIGSNRNDILTRFFETGSMTSSAVVPSYSPSMDIQISSNFERYFYELNGRDASKVVAAMDEFKVAGSFAVDRDTLAHARNDFMAYRLSDEGTNAVIKKYYDAYGYVLDPHTAVGVSAAEQSGILNEGAPVVSLACAHPAKFPDTVEQSISLRPELPDYLSDLLSREERYTIMDNDYESIKNFIMSVK